MPLGSTGSWRGGPEGESFEETHSQASQEARPACGAEPGVVHLLDAFHLLTQDATLQEVPERRGFGGRSTRAWVSSSAGPRWLPGRPECHPLLVGWPLRVLEEGAATTPVLLLSETLGTLALLAQLPEEVAQAHRATLSPWQQKPKGR